MTLPPSHFFLIIISIGFYAAASSSSTSEKTIAVTKPSKFIVFPTSTTVDDCACGLKGKDGDGRIVGGDDAGAQEYPWQVIEDQGPY